MGHLDGHEENSHPLNLIWNCRACNTKVGIVFKRVGLGRPTKQYNPQAQAARNLAQWLMAVLSMKGESTQMTVQDAVAMVRATRLEDRSRYAREIWQKRRQHYGPSGKYSDIPF